MGNENKYKSLIKNTFIFAAGSMGSKLILFFLVPLYTNYLTKEEYGVADLIFTMSQLVIPFVSLVIWEATMRFALSKSEKKEDVLLCSLIVWCIGSVVILLATPLLELYAPIAEWKWHLSVYMIINIFLSIELNYIKAKEQNKLYAIVSIMQTLTMALVNILLIVIIPLGVSGYVFANISSNLVAVLAIFLFGRIFRDVKNAKFSSSLLKRMLVFSSPLVLNNISWWVLHSLNKFIVEVALGAAVLGIFTVATKIPSLINMLISIFQQSWGVSSIKEIESINDTKFYSNIFDVYSFIAFFVSIGFILIIKPFMTIYVGTDFVDAWRYVPLLLVSASFSAISSYFGSLLNALKRSVNGMIATLIAAIVNAIISLTLINYIGLWGAILGTFAAYIVLALIRMLYALKFIRMRIDAPRVILNSLILTAQAVLVSLEIEIYLVSVIAIILFIIVNFKVLNSLFTKLKGRKI